MEKLSGLCVLLAALSQVVAGVKVTPAYFLNGGELKLNVTPAYSEGISNILWKFKGNLLAEWVQNQVPLELYGTFKGRTDLDTTNGGLVVRRMSKADMGAYTVEINSKVHGESYDAQMIKDLSFGVKVEVALRTLTCNAETEICDVSCEADITQAGPVTYSWKIGQRDWEVFNSHIAITKAENANDETITCRISNPLSEGVSELFKNPLYHSSNTGQIVAWVVVSSLLVVIGGLVVALLWHKNKCCFKNLNSNNKATTDPKGEPSTNPAEQLSLTNKTPDGNDSV